MTIVMNAPLSIRLTLGGTFFAIYALADLYRNGRAATRWREYAFLLFCAVAAMGYGAINDQLTSSISWEYFYYGKALSKSLGPQTPPNAVALHWAAAKVGIAATWSAGLIIGVALLISNNPRPGVERLSFRDLAAWLPLIFGITIVCSIVGAILGAAGMLNLFGQDFRDLWASNLWRPSHFMATWGIHLGGYVGGAAGTAFAVRGVLRARIRRDG